MKHLLTIILFHLVLQINAQSDLLKQRALKRFDFIEFTIPLEDDTIFYYVNIKENAQPDKVILYLQGTTPNPDPFFEIEKIDEGYSYVSYIPQDHKELDQEFIYVIIAPPGIPAVKGQGFLDLERYHRLNSLDYRVFAADTVIGHISSTLFEPNKVIVYGHSEGAFVAPKLATINRRITHLGVWGGGALNDFYDFILFERKANLRGEQSDSVTQTNIDEIIALFEDIVSDPLDTVPTNDNEITEYTNKRWWSYAEPTINHLIKLDIPIFVQVGSEDESAPVESNFLIPLEFARLGKTNLSFNVCVGCDHGFVNIHTHEDQWTTIFREFIIWTEER